MGGHEPLEVRHQDGLTTVLPERALSLRRHLPALRALGLRHFLYDLTYTPSPAKHAREILARTVSLDPATETEMNFTRGLL